MHLPVAGIALKMKFIPPSGTIMPNPLASPLSIAFIGNVVPAAAEINAVASHSAHTKLPIPKF
jgi:hypothetical protein